MFQTPPEWWGPLANLTDWFDWDALGAVGSVGALIFAITLATRDSRERRYRDGSIIMAVMHPLSSAVNVLNSQWNAGLAAGQAPEVVFNRVLSTGVFEEMRIMMEEVSIKELPTPAAIDAFIAARSALRNIVEEGANLASVKPRQLVLWVPERLEDLIAYHEQLAGEALRFVPRKKLLAEMTRGGPDQVHTRWRRSGEHFEALRMWLSERIRSKKD